MLHDPKTVIGSDFDQETAEKIAPPFIARLELANCTRFTFLTLDFEGGESLVDDLAAGEGGRLARGHDLQRQVSKGIKTSSLTWKTQASSCLPIAFSPMQNSVP